MNHLLTPIISFLIGNFISFSAAAFEEYTVSSFDSNAGSQISINYTDTYSNTQKEASIGDLSGINILPSIAKYDNQQFVAVWQHFNAGNYYLHFSVGAKDSWSAPLRIDTGMVVNVSPFVANIGSQVILFWSSTVKDQDFIYYSLFNKEWSSPERVPGQTLPINTLPRVVSEQGAYFIEWLASSPTSEYTIQRHQLDASILRNLSSARTPQSKQQRANKAATAFANHSVGRRPAFRDSASVDSPHTQFSLKIENGQSKHQVRKILEY